jgi:hypothetical protein
VIYLEPKPRANITWFTISATPSMLLSRSSGGGEDKP